MRFFILSCILCLALLDLQGTPPRIIQISGNAEKIKDVEIVVEQRTPLLDYAARELQDFLQISTGVKPKIVSRPTGNSFALILGNTSFARSAGLDVDRLPAEGYYIVRKGNRLFLAGRDHPNETPVRNSYWQNFQRGTLSAVYDFLERFAGVRFYFPGPHGTIVAKKGVLELPEKISVTERPDLNQRTFYHGNTKLYPGYPVKDGPNGNTLTRSRLRFSETHTIRSHGLNDFEYIKRFGKTHPEYFALMSDGKRYCDPKQPRPGQLCFSSGIREIIYQDAKARLLQRPASERGISRWKDTRNPYIIGLGPQDNLYWCGCEKCKKIAEPGRGKIYSDPAEEKKVSDFYWKMIADMGFRLKKERVPGRIALSAYPPRRCIPEFALPDNINVVVTLNGLGANREETEILRSWKKKLERRPFVWTYAFGKHMQKNIPGIPPMMPKKIGEFIHANRDLMDGGFFESESDTFLSQYLNYYVLAKKLWDNNADVDKILDEHYALMFGKGAPMKHSICILAPQPNA